MEPIELDATWPGWGEGSTLGIALDPARWPPPTEAACIDGGAFAPKAELHVTVVGKALGAELRAAIADGRIGPDALRDCFEGQRWRLRRSGWRVRLRKPAESSDALPKESLIEPVALPAMARFHAFVGRALGRNLPVPPPHVTLYVRGDPAGIGVPDEATLARLRVGAAWRAAG